jgi:hypothetical protein
MLKSIESPWDVNSSPEFSAPGNSASAVAAAGRLRAAWGAAWLALACGMLTGLLTGQHGVAAEPVRFDAPAIAVAEAVDPGLINQPTTGGKLLRLRMPVSTFIAPTFHGTIKEFIVEIDSPQQSLRVLDFWPKTELYSDIEGSIAVDDQLRKDQQLAFSVAGGYPGVGGGNASGDLRTQQQQQLQQRYSRRPPMQVLTSSGTLHRGYGVFFKFRPGDNPLLEGDREVALLVEAPHGWRGDLLQFTLRAVGHSSSSSLNARPQVLAAARMWTAVHQAHDPAAAEAARQFVHREQAVRHLAATSAGAISDRALPTVFHKVGAALDVVEPKIPRDYLAQILFASDPAYFDAATSRLPVDLRVAALDYWDQRKELLALARR